MSTLSEFLADRQILQQDFARRIGVTQATVSKLAKRAMMPSLPLAVAIERETSGEVPASSWVDPSAEACAQQNAVHDESLTLGGHD